MGNKSNRPAKRSTYDCIIPNIFGRLGNNLFIIAHAYAQALAHDKHLIICRDQVNYQDDYPDGIFRKLDIRSHPFPKDGDNNTNPSAPPGVEPTIYSGHFQSEQYFKKQKKRIKSLFEPTKEFVQTAYAAFPGLPLSTVAAVQIRRGDYLNYPLIHPCVTPEYVHEAIKRLPHTDCFFIFSDDIRWCKTNIKLPSSVYIEDFNTYEQLWLMSLCDHFVIANSSFSWWGAYLSANPDKVVVAPQTWYGPEGPEKWDDIYCEGWVILPTYFKNGYIFPVDRKGMTMKYKIILKTTHKHSARVKACLNTWLKNKDYICLTDKLTNEFNEISGSSRDDYRSAEEKTVFAVNHIKDNEAYNEYDWLAFIDDDAILNTKMFEFILPFLDKRKLYGLHMRGASSRQPELDFPSGGAGYFISPELIKKKQHMNHQDLGAEDVSMGHYIHENHIDFEDCYYIHGRKYAFKLNGWSPFSQENKKLTEEERKSPERPLKILEKIQDPVKKKQDILACMTHHYIRDPALMEYIQDTFQQWTPDDLETNLVPTDSSLSAPVPDRSPLTRTPGYVMMLEGEDLIIWSQHNPNRMKLNHTAALIWLLCDGQFDAVDIGNRLKKMYPQKAAQIDTDLPSTIKDLWTRGLVGFADDQPAVKPLYRVGFTYLWPGFDQHDNYFLWMLTQRMDVILVDPRKEDPDILFCSNNDDDDVDHHSIDRHVTRKVICTVGEQSPDFSQYDYVFAIGSAKGHWMDRGLGLPTWSIFLDWDRHAKLATLLGNDSDPERYHPRKVGNLLYEALFPDTLDQGRESRKSDCKSAPPHAGKSPTIADRSKIKLTIGMATYDDFDGVYFTVQSLRLYHPEVTKDTEIIVIDNNPDGPCAEPLEKLGGKVDGYRYVPYRDVQSTTVKDLVFRHARARHVMCLDSHVLLMPGSVKKLIAYFDQNPGAMDLFQGPLVYDDLTSVSTHFNPVWSGGMHGVWATDERGKKADNEPFDIPMQGMGLFACRQDAWVGFNPRFSGFGGEEGYIHEKFRKLGRRTLCLPFLRWVHRFNRPFGTRYRNIWEDRIRNYYIGFHELDLDTSAMEIHFREHLGHEVFERIKSEVQQEMNNPFFFFDAIYCINLYSEETRWQMMETRFKKLGILNRVRRLNDVETAIPPIIGRTLSHRMIIEQAQKRGLNQVLIFEDETIFQENALEHLAKALHELKSKSWDLFYLGGYGGDQPSSAHEDGCFLEKCGQAFTDTCGIAYHQSVYDKILKDVPGEAEKLNTWIDTHHGIGQYLSGFKQRFVASPEIAYRLEDNGF